MNEVVESVLYGIRWGRDTNALHMVCSYSCKSKSSHIYNFYINGGKFLEKSFGFLPVRLHAIVGTAYILDFSLLLVSFHIIITRRL